MFICQHVYFGGEKERDNERERERRMDKPSKNLWTRIDDNTVICLHVEARKIECLVQRQVWIDTCLIYKSSSLSITLIVALRVNNCISVTNDYNFSIHLIGFHITVSSCHFRPIMMDQHRVK